MNLFRSRTSLGWKTLAVLAACLLVFGLSFQAFASGGSWGLGPYQLINGPSTGPLRATMTGSSSLRSYGFVGKVGGVAFGGVAEPGSSLQGRDLRPVYDASKPDGERFGLRVDSHLYGQRLPDWVLVPVARYADSSFNACVSLFGEGTTESYYDIVYHEAFENTLLGVRLLQNDILLFDLEEMWRLPELGGKIVLGQGEVAPHSLNRASASELTSRLAGGTFQSWVLTDESERVQVDLVDGSLRFTGLPYYYFWRSNFESYVLEYQRLKAQALAARRTGDVLEYNRIADQINQLEPTIYEVKQLTLAIRESRPALRNFNPAVYDAATRTMHYAALFRHLKSKSPETWKAFLRSLPPAASLQPSVTTPTRWAK